MNSKDEEIQTIIDNSESNFNIYNKKFIQNIF